MASYPVLKLNLPWLSWLTTKTLPEEAGRVESSSFSWTSWRFPVLSTMVYFAQLGWDRCLWHSANCIPKLNVRAKLLEFTIPTETVLGLWKTGQTGRPKWHWQSAPNTHPWWREDSSRPADSRKCYWGTISWLHGPYGVMSCRVPFCPHPG